MSNHETIQPEREIDGAVECGPVAPTTEQAASPASRRTLGILGLILVLAVVVALGLAIYSGITARAAAEAKLTENTDQAAITTVDVVYPEAGAPTQEVVLPGNTQAFTDTPIYARTNGYLKHWYFDIGAHVKQGQLLADIETPEIDKQLQQAKAELATAQANSDLAKTTAARWEALLKSDSVSKQETDEKVSDLSAKRATVNSNESNVRRLEDLQSFQKVYAPFDGIITARNTDIGALIDSGSNSPGKELFHLAAIHHLRVYVAIPEVFSRAARPGSKADLTLDEFPGRTFHGTLTRTSDAIDIASRTLNAEVDVANPSGELLPGAYVFVHLKLPEQIQSITIPANTLLFRAEGLRAATIHDNKAVLLPVTIGRDYGNAVEIVSGLKKTDPVIANPSDSLVNGTPVQINAAQSEIKPGTPHAQQGLTR